MRSIRMTELYLPRLHQLISFNSDLVQQLLIIRIVELGSLHDGSHVAEDLLLPGHAQHDALDLGLHDLYQVLDEVFGASLVDADLMDHIQFLAENLEGAHHRAAVISSQLKLLHEHKLQNIIVFPNNRDDRVISLLPQVRASL